MDSRHSDTLELIGRLRECARRRDWNSAAQLTNALTHQSPPTGPEAMGEYLRALKGALAVARTSRAEAGALLNRVNAAASFNSTRYESAPHPFAPQRQNFGDMPGS